MKTLKNTSVLLVRLFLFIAWTGCEQKDGDSAKHPSITPASEWKRFSSDSGRFTVLFPGSPEEKVQTVQGLGGREMEAHAFLVEADKQTFYGANYADVPTNIDLQNPQMYFDKAQALATGEKGKIVFQQDVRVGGYPGREFEFVAGGKANYSARFRVFFVGQRMYTLHTVFLTTNPHAEDRKTFFDSFRLSTRN